MHNYVGLEESDVPVHLEWNKLFSSAAVVFWVANTQEVQWEIKLLQRVTFQLNGCNTLAWDITHLNKFGNRSTNVKSTCSHRQQIVSGVLTTFLNSAAHFRDKAIGQDVGSEQMRKRGRHVTRLTNRTNCTVQATFNTNLQLKTCKRTSATNATHEIKMRTHSKVVHFSSLLADNTIRLWWLSY